ncbi:MAG: phosphomannomutase [Gammaproteobacteria bacterium]|jgi:phosphomannomutase
MAEKIKFGTDGWRAIIAKEFTVNNVARLTKGLATWAKSQEDNPAIIVGHDCRFGGELFAETVAKVLLDENIKVFLCKGYISTPMLSMATKNYNCVAGVVITASHNPPSYNGYKLKANFGGPMQGEGITAVENEIPDSYTVDLDKIKLLDHEGVLLSYPNIEADYIKAINENFDLKAIENANMGLAYDAMYGSGQAVMKKILPNINFYRCEENPSFYGLSPEPIMKNLHGFSDFIKSNSGISCGLVTDGDADRIGLMDEEGNFVDAHHIILLLIHYLHHYKGLTGKVVTAFSSVNKIKDMCKHYNLPIEIVKIGFKYAAGIIVKENVMVGGEESGGIAITGHIPERDGIWMGLTLWEFMAKSGKTLNELIQEVYDIVGAFNFKRNDLRLDQEVKDNIVDNCKNGKYSSFGNYEVQSIEDMDGWKYILSDDSWVMIRPSGTEPVLRIYAEGKDEEATNNIVNATIKTITNA